MCSYYSVLSASLNRCVIVWVQYSMGRPAECWPHNWDQSKYISLPEIKQKHSLQNNKGVCHVGHVFPSFLVQGFDTLLEMTTQNSPWKHLVVSWSVWAKACGPWLTPENSPEHIPEKETRKKKCRCISSLPSTSTTTTAHLRCTNQCKQAFSSHSASLCVLFVYLNPEPWLLWSALPTPPLRKAANTWKWSGAAQPSC